MNRSSQRGVTLIEMLIVVSIIALMASVSYPAFTAGIESLRLNSASNAIVSLLNEGLNRAARRGEVVELTISKPQRALTLRSSDPGFSRRLELPQGVAIAAVLPENPESDAPVRQFMLYPGGTAPRIGVVLAGSRNSRRVVRVDPITGVPQIERAGQ